MRTTKGFLAREVMGEIVRDSSKSYNYINKKFQRDLARKIC